MVCPSCGVPNPDGNLLCVHCAAPLTGPGAAGDTGVGERHSASTVLVRQDELGDLLEDASPEIRAALRPETQTPVPSRTTPKAGAPLGASFDRVPTNLRRLATGKALSLVIRDRSDEVTKVVGLSSGRTYIGRTEGDLMFGDDPEMSPLHGRIAVSDDESIRVRDLDSLNGTWLRFTGEAPLIDGDRFIVASQRFSYHESWGNPAPGDDGTALPAPAGWDMPHRVVAYGPSGVPVHVHMCDEDLVIGREGRSPYQGDPRMARRHATVMFTADGTIVRDLSGSGIYRKLRAETEVRDGDLIAMGSRTFMIRTGA